MFDIAWSEMLVLLVIAIIVIGPKDLPRVMRAMGGWMRKARGLANDFRLGVDELAREADLEDLRRNAAAAKNFDPNRAIKKALDPTGDLAGDLAGDMDQLIIPPPPEADPGKTASGAETPDNGTADADAGKKS